MVDFSVKIVSSWPVDQIKQLYEAGGWWKPHYDATQLPKLVKGSFAFAVAVHPHTKQAIGMGRVISDGVSDGYIQDVVVLPLYRDCGVGSKIIKKLVQFCRMHHISWIGLIAEPGYESFYTPLGFHVMKQYIPMLCSDEDSLL